MADPGHSPPTVRAQDALANIVYLDTPLTRWERLCAAVRAHQVHPCPENKRAVDEAHAAYIAGQPKGAA